MTATRFDFTAVRTLWLHTGLLFVLLIGLLALVNTGQVGFADEGIYSAQVDNLSRGSWSAVRPARDIDAGGDRVAATSSIIVGDSYVPYARQALYPIVLLPAFTLGGVTGMLLLSILGTVVAALSAGLLARRIDPALGIPALWIAGVGSPLLFDAYLIVGHSLAAAIAGMLAVSMCSVLDDRRPVWLVAAIPLAAALTLIRSEGLLVVLGLGLVACCSAFSIRPRPTLNWRPALTGATLGLTGVATYLGNLRITAAITAAGSAAPVVTDRDADAVSSAWISLLRPWDADQRLASTEAALMMVCTVLAVLTYRLLPRLRLLSIGLLVMAAGSSILVATGDLRLISGLLPVFPAAVIGIGLLSRADLGRPVVSRSLSTSVVVAVGILATAYGVGGAAEWGGRFFHVLIPMLTATSVVGLTHAKASLPAMQFRVVGVALLVMIVSLGSLSLRVNHAYRSAALAVLDQTAAFVEERGGEPTPAVVLATLAPTGEARIFWRELGQGREVLAAGNLGGLRQVIEDASAVGRTSIVVVTNADVGLLEVLLGSELQDAGWSVLESTPISGSSFGLVLLGADPALRS